MIFVDMDGVLADFVGSACKVHDKPAAAVDAWNFFEAWGIDEDAFWAPINAGGREFWSTLDVYPWFDVLIDAVAQIDPNFYVLTKPSHNPDCLAGKLDWLHRQFGSRFRRYFFAPDKSPLGRTGRLLIDDSDANCDGFSRAGGDTILLPQPWNDNNWRIEERDRTQYVLDKLAWFKDRKEALCPAKP